MGPHKGAFDQKFGFSWYVYQGPSYGLILLDTWSRCACISLVQSRCPGDTEGGKIAKISHFIPSSSPKVYVTDT